MLTTLLSFNRTRTRRRQVRVFGTFTEDLHRLCEWLVACRVTTAAMESTGVFWIPLYDLLEARGVMPCLVNAGT